MNKHLSLRISTHPILGNMEKKREVHIQVDGKQILAYEGEPIAAALMANGIKVFRTTPKRGESRGVFCAIGRCTDCVMSVDGEPHVRTCVTRVKRGMKIETQRGLGKWGKEI